jgi:hypothetical protein
MKLEKGKWYYRVSAEGFGGLREGDGNLSLLDDWQEVESPVIKIIEKPKTLADVEPKVGMFIIRPYWIENSCPFQIVAVQNGYFVTVDLINESNINAYAISNCGDWLVVAPKEELNMNQQKLTVEESLRPEHVGKKGRWKRRDGKVVEDKLVLDEHEIYPVDIGDSCYMRNGRQWRKDSSVGDLVEFIGWVEE